MSEEEWLACAEPNQMCDFLWSNASDRKLRLFACACCRQVEFHLWGGEWSHRAITVAEKYADQFTTRTELEAAQTAVENQLELYHDEPVYDASFWACNSDMTEGAWLCAFYAANCSVRVIEYGTQDFDAKCKSLRNKTLLAQATVLRDIFGNPFRPVSVDPAWLTSDVLALARGIYDERAFDRMPILADALQDAGCTNDDILSHCRDTSAPHARGCWVVDRILNKS